jgi:hypothetical protein
MDIYKNWRFKIYGVIVVEYTALGLLDEIMNGNQTGKETRKYFHTSMKSVL